MHDPSRSGPAVATLFQRLLALVSLLAFLSLGSQLMLLVGTRGLLPAQRMLERAAEHGLGPRQLPTGFWLNASDAVLMLGIGVGALLAVLALLGFAPRLCFALSAPLYLSYAVLCDAFTAFQWDNMLVETTLLAALLPAGRSSATAHLAFRVLLFKLYFESGIAKWQSYLGDWQDGSAMSFYYETAPIPTWLGWYAHQLPASWHKLESWGALVLELLIPWLIWGPRASRLLAFAAFTGFQVLNTLTANYGFFTYLSLTLSVFLLSDGDVLRVNAWMRSALPWRRGMSAPAASLSAIVVEPSWRQAAGVLLFTLYVAASTTSAILSFSRSDVLREQLRAFHALYAPFRVANVYHLFGHITRERVEPEFQTLEQGQWITHDLRYKAGDPLRPPPYVAPHQPRVDFLLWFYGLGHRAGMPQYVGAILEKLCSDPSAVQPLFAKPIPENVRAVRVGFQRYRFTSQEESARDGAWWTREWLGALQPRQCAH